MSKSNAKLPEHEAIYKRVRDLILFGEVQPGQPVTILGLKERVGAGVTPVREAIRRLTAEGALEALGNRRVCVPVLSLERLEEIYFARLAIEPHMAKIAALSIEEVDISHLRKLDEQVNAAIAAGDVGAYLENNFRFHYALYDCARMPVLRKIALSLWLQAGPSLRVICGRYGTSSLPDMHSAATSALASRDAEATARAIEGDIAQGLDLLRQSLAET